MVRITKSNESARSRVIGAWATLVARGERATTRAIAELSGVNRSTVGEHRMMLMPYYGGDERDDDCPIPHDEIQRRIALVRAAKARLPMLAGLDATTLDMILPD